MLRQWTDGWNGITIVIGLLVLVSIYQGMVRGASSSAKRLAMMISEGLLVVVSVLLAWKLAEWLSPLVQDWLSGRRLEMPAEEPLEGWKPLYYGFVTSVRDFGLFRFGLLFIIAYAIVKSVLHRMFDLLLYGTLRENRESGIHEAVGADSGSAGRARRMLPFWLSSLFGAMIGSASGLARALMVVAVLFAATTLFPHSPAALYIQASSLYQMGASKVIQPVTGELITERLPVFTRAVEEEFANILQRKYEVLDAHIPDDIAEAAKEIAADGNNDEQKAKLLYQWVGTRIAYDWEKVRLYEEERIWKEQTPEQTFASRLGVCIDFSRLYAVMARAVGLEVKVVTGLGYDGRGGYGPHAWNEVYLSEKEQWVPLDATWVSSGGNWFNPPDFYETHVKEG